MESYQDTHDVSIAEISFGYQTRDRSSRTSLALKSCTSAIWWWWQHWAEPSTAGGSDSAARRASPAVFGSVLNSTNPTDATMAPFRVSSTFSVPLVTASSPPAASWKSRPSLRFVRQINRLDTHLFVEVITKLGFVILPIRCSRLQKVTGINIKIQPEKQTSDSGDSSERNNKTYLFYFNQVFLQVKLLIHLVAFFFK